MSFIGFALLVLQCSMNSDDCKARPLSPKVYESQQECEDARWAQAGYYKLDELVCAEVRR